MERTLVTYTVGDNSVPISGSLGTSPISFLHQAHCLLMVTSLFLSAVSYPEKT
jgi:hypothetical protein